MYTYTKAIQMQQRAIHKALAHILGRLEGGNRVVRVPDEQDRVRRLDVEVALVALAGVKLPLCAREVVGMAPEVEEPLRRRLKVQVGRPHAVQAVHARLLVGAADAENGLGGGRDCVRVGGAGRRGQGRDGGGEVARHDAVEGGGDGDELARAVHGEVEDTEHVPVTDEAGGLVGAGEGDGDGVGLEVLEEGEDLLFKLVGGFVLAVEGASVGEGEAALEEAADGPVGGGVRFVLTVEES